MAFDFDTPPARRGTWSARWERYPAEVIPLWVADTDYRAPQPVLEALQRRVAHGILGYSLEPPELRAAVVERMQRLYRWTIKPEWIVFLPGVVAGLHLAVRHLVGAEQHVLVPSPVYHHLTGAPDRAPRPYSKVPLVLRDGRWVFDEQLLSAAVRPGSRMLMLCNPQNPGGTVFTRAELEQLAAFAARHELLICSDEIHADLVLDQGKAHVPIASVSADACRRTVTLISPNKTFNFPGVGCAFAIIENDMLRRAYGVDHHATVHDAPVLGYDAALAAYRDGADWLAAQLAYLRGNRELVEQAVASTPGLAMAHVEATYLAWIDASGLGVADPQKHLLEHGVALSPGSQFGEAQFVRLNFGTQRATLERALEKIRIASRQSPRG